jgi:acetyl esterase/lipase
MGLAWVIALGVGSLLYSPIEKRVAAVRLLLLMKEEDRTEAPRLGNPVIDLTLATGERVSARVYGPPAKSARLSIVLGHGIHHLGINEPRLVRFARHLASLGCHVLTPELRDLSEYDVTSQGIDVLSASVRYLSEESGEQVGLIGFSFAGGLALVAAQERKVSSDLLYVASIGGYQDLSRTLRFLATNQVEGPEGMGQRRAHEYGLLVLLKGNLEALELGDDRELVQSALSAWLKEDRKTAREYAKQMSGAQAQEIFALLEAQRLTDLAPKLLGIIASRGEPLAALSPAGRLSQIHTRVLLLHGSGDTVVPPEETLFAERELEESKQAGRALVTPLLEHVRIDRPAGIRQQWELVELVAQLL